MAAVEVERLKRVFSGKKSTAIALDGVDLDVKQGEIFGLLGPNGAGKTTLIRILSTLLLPSSGNARVESFDVVKNPERVRPLISMASGAERAGYDFITPRGNLWFFSQLYGISSDVARTRIEGLASALELDGHLDKKMYTLSTGYRQRVTIARAFVNDPRVVFMDEPTMGLDVMTAKKIRGFLVSQAKDSKRTIFLATHNMVEGETICDRVAIIDKGKILACDSPSALKKVIGVPALVMEVSPPIQSSEFLSSLPGVTGATSTLDPEREVSTIKVLVDNERVYESARKAVESKGLKVLTTYRQESSLEEVFIKLVGSGFTEREMQSGN